MAGKKAKPRKTTKKLVLESLKPSDVLCPICRTILIEPVTLSCNHVFCKLCFEGTMENANLVCPLCRIRVGSWFRKAKKEGKLVDQVLWEAIQVQYHAEVKNRYQGIDNVMEADVPIIVVATPGEIRKEYEQQRQRELEEQKILREAEEKASAPLIKKLREEEEHKKQIEEEKLRLDEALAKKLTEDLERPKPSKFTPKKANQPRKPESNKKSGPMDKFIKIEEPKSNRLSLNKSEERKALYKGGRKRISITPNLASDFATKEYTCHVLNAEGSTKADKDIVKSVSALSKPGSSKSSQGNVKQTIQKKGRQARKVEAESSKSIYKSGYKSSESGSDDAIDQECRFYFKPVDTQRRYHLSGIIPVKVPSLRGRKAVNVCIEPPAGKIINLQLGTVLSAFAQYSMALQQSPPSTSLPMQEPMKEETLYQHVSSNRLKRKLLDDYNPAKRKERRKIYSKKNLQYNDDIKDTVSSPFFGFENESSKVVNGSPFYGFSALEIKGSNRNHHAMKKLLEKHEESEKYLVSSEGLYKNFKTYSRHRNRQFKLDPLSANMKSTEEPLRMQISRTQKNGISLSKATQKELTLQCLVEGSSEDCEPKKNIDINRNIPKVKVEPSLNNCGHGKQKRNSCNSDSTSKNTTFKNLKEIMKSEDVLATSSSSEYKKEIFLNNDMKRDTKGADFASGDRDVFTFGSNTGKYNKSKDSTNISLRSMDSNSRVQMDTGLIVNIAGQAGNTRGGEHCGIMDTDSKTVLADSKLVNSKEEQNRLNTQNLNSDLEPLNIGSLPVNSRLNGSYRTKQSKGSPRKSLNSLRKKDCNLNSAELLVLDKIRSIVESAPTANESTDSENTSKSTKLDDSPSHSVHKTYHSKTRNAVFVDTNSKITDTFSKVKSSPTKPKNTIKNFKLSPTKTKLNNNVELDLESVRVNGEIDVDQRQVQERSDFEMAKKLQAEFDSLQMPSRTRRGTTRQITLEEMLLV